MGPILTLDGRTYELLQHNYPMHAKKWPRWLLLPLHIYGDNPLITPMLKERNPNYHAIGLIKADPGELVEYFESLLPADFEQVQDFTQTVEGGHTELMASWRRDADKCTIRLDCYYGAEFEDCVQVVVGVFESLDVEFDGSKIRISF